MNLKCNHTFGRGFVLLIIDDFGCHRSVDEMLEVIPISDDTKIIPFSGMDRRS